ncbi:hypothetical protein HYV80_01100 [Candidatus Woesearchaeota archaeon]|nr:hypothetical protein [Candidatus Woesearchaeota archaeon]
MDDRTQKERLEQELRFLKESFEAEVISKEEFEKGRDRIEKKLHEMAKPPQNQKEGQKNEAAEKKEIPKTDESIIHNEGGKLKLKVIQEEQHEHFEPVPATSSERTEYVEPSKEISGKKDSKFLKYSIVFVVLLLAAFFLYSTFKDINLQNEKIVPLNPVQEIKEAPKTNLLVINDRKNCFNCDTERIIAILENWFGDLNAREIDYSTNEGRSIAEKSDAKLLPLYILDENITQKQNFNQFKQIFSKKNGSYVLNENTAGSAFYFKRDNIPNKLDLFANPGDEASTRAEKNLDGFLAVFKDVKFEKYSGSSSLAKELGIKTFPTFLVNNKVKFSGVHSPESIKANFCRLNKMPACEKSLSKNLA